MLCGARNRSGGRCRHYVSPGHRRCWLHGARSTGPRTVEGLQRTVNAMWQGRRRWIAQLHAQGRKAPGGRPSGRWWKTPADEHERTIRKMSDFIGGLPAGPIEKPIEQWTLPELLSDTARQSLMQLRAIIMQPLKLKRHVDDVLTAEDLKLQRVVGDYGLGADRLLARVQEAAMRKADNEDWRGLLKRLEQAKVTESKLLSKK